MKTPRLSMTGRNPGILSEDRVYAASQVPPQASSSENLVLHWLDTIDKVDASYVVDANSERSHGSNLDDPKLQRPPLEGSGVKHPPVQVSKLVNEKWPHLRPKQSPKFQRHRRKSDRPERVLLELNVESLRARKLKTSMKKRRPQSRKKRKRRSVLEDLFASWNAVTRTLDKNLLLDRGGVDEPQYLRYARLANLGIDKVDAQELTSFTGLLYLDLSENHVSMERLTVFATLQKLNLQCNKISEVAIAEGSFVVLEVLDLSYNFLLSPALYPLSTLPKLRKLNIDFNNVSIILEAGIVETSFPSLERLYAAGNGLSAQSLLSLSKLPKLERLYVRGNHVASIPEQLGSESYKFPLLQVLDLASNPIKDHSSLASLRKICRLRKVMLWDTPLVTKVGYDLNGKCLPIARPILLSAMQAQREGQTWLLYKPIKAGELQPIQSEEVLSHVVSKPKAFRPVLFPSEKMVKAFDKVCQQAGGQPQCTSDPAEETVHGGSSSMSKPVMFAHTSPRMSNATIVDMLQVLNEVFRILQLQIKFADGMENHVTISQQDRQPQKDDSPKQPAFAPMLMEKELKKIQDTKIPVDPNPKEPKAHVLSLKLALQMIPFRGVDEEIDPPSYRMPTKLHKIQEHTTRLNLQAPVSARKRALFIARRFADRAEREAKEQVQSMLEKLGQQLEDMKTRILDINDYHLNAPEPELDYLTDENTEP